MFFNWLHKRLTAACFCPRPLTLTSGSLPDFGLHRCCVQILLQTIWTSGCTTRACHGCSWDEPHRKWGSLAAILAAFLASLLSCCVNQWMFVPAPVEVNLQPRSGREAFDGSGSSGVHRPQDVSQSDWGLAAFFFLKLMLLLQMFEKEHFFRSTERKKNLN